MRFPSHGHPLISMAHPPSGCLARRSPLRLLAHLNVCFRVVKHHPLWHLDGHGPALRSSRTARPIRRQREAHGSGKLDRFQPGQVTRALTHAGLEVPGRFTWSRQRRRFHR